MPMKSCWFPAVLSLLAFTCDDSGGVPDDISGACQRQRECWAAEVGSDAVAADRDECPDRLSAEYDQASSYGCGGTYADWVSCQATQRGNCPPPVVLDESSGDSSGT